MVTAIRGCRLYPLDPERARQILYWAMGRGSPDPHLKDTKWLLAYCHDGVVWGRWDGCRWCLGSDPFPELVPKLAKENLLELRLFGPDSEALIWRVAGEFQGRLLVDAAEHVPPDDPLAPIQEEHVLIGDRLWGDAPTRDGFTAVGDATGSRHVIPLECRAEDFSGNWWPLRLVVRHYLEQDPRTGTVRVAASRLVNLRVVRKGAQS